MTDLAYDLRSGAPSTSSEELPSRADPIWYGVRPRSTRAADGATSTEYTPRTRDELLNPQEGDEMGQDSLHLLLLRFFLDILEERYPPGGEIAVFGDFLTRFQRQGLTNANPDVCLVRGLRDPERRRKSLDQDEGEILLAIEIVSPDYAFKDYDHNPRLYERAGIEEYLIIDLLGDDLSGPYKLSGYRMDPATTTYRPIELDSQDRLPSAVTGLQIGVDPTGGGLVVTDAATGERLLTPKERAAELEAKVARLEALLRQAR